MHVFTHLKPDSMGKTGKGIHADGMAEHDGHVGQLLDQLSKTSASPTTRSCSTRPTTAPSSRFGPMARMTMFRGEKGTTWEGGFRIPMMVRWPGVVKPGTQVNEIDLADRLVPDLLPGGRSRRISRSR
jgi:hypothetical protein